jgi:hypothetical protein
MSAVEHAPAEVHGNARAERRRRLLLACGIVYGVVYVISNDLIAASAHHGYSRRDRVVSELSAGSAPTRPSLIATLPSTPTS